MNQPGKNIDAGGRGEIQPGRQQGEEGGRVTLENLVTDPKYNFLNQFNPESNEFLDYNFNEANDNPYENHSLTCNYYDELSYAKKFKNLKNLSIFSLNVQSLSAKYNDIKELFNLFSSHSCSPDIVCLQETWKIFDSSYFVLPNYSPLQVKSRENRQGGGVGLYIKNGIQFQVLSEKSLFLEYIIESVVVEIVLENKKKIAVVSLYRPATPHPNLTQKDQMEQFLELFTNLVNDLQNSYSDVYIFGDVNIDVLKYDSVPAVQDYVDLLFSLGLLQIITRPTRCSANSATLIDHAILNPKSAACESAIITSKISDHFPIIYICDTFRCSRVEKTVTFRDYSEQNIQRFKETIHYYSWNTVLNEEDTQTAFNDFSGTLSHLHDVFFPIQTKRFNRNINSIEKWMTKGILISRQTKFKLSHKCLSEPSPVNAATYKVYRNCYNATVRAAKKLYYERQFQMHKSNLKKTWKLLKETINQNLCKTSEIGILLINGEEIANPKLIAESLNNFFINAATEIVNSIPPADPPPEQPPPHEEIPLLSFTDSPVTHSEVLAVISSLQNKFSTDSSGLSVHFIKQFSHQIAKPLQHIINLSLANSVVPTQMKIAKIVPIHKGGSRVSMDNYRPISLLSCFSKILEKVVCNRLCSFLETNSILSGAQFGFRHGHSTIHPMVHFVNHVSTALNNKEHTIAIFCDLRKAFDSCDHKILLQKLSAIGIRGAALSWFKNYLSDRKQFVSVNGHNSSLMNVLLGVPQGSILGPILFLLYINDLPLCSLLKDFLFADDTTLLKSGPDLPELVNSVNVEFHKVCTYFRRNRLALHPQKTQFMLFSNSRDAKDTQIKISVNNNNPGVNNPDLCIPIERVTAHSSVPAVKFLGVYFDCELNFKYHIRTICAKISRALYMLRTCKNLLSQKALKTLYYSLVHCHLVYGNQIWSSASAGTISELFRKQKAAIRIITNSRYNQHTEPLFKGTNILPLPNLCDFFKLQFMQRFIQGFLPCSFNNTWISNVARRPETVSMVLRNHDDFYVPISRLKTLESFPLYSFPKLWENFPDENIKFIRNVNEFNKSLKEYFLAKLSLTVVCTKAYCPSCNIFLRNRT